MTSYQMCPQRERREKRRWGSGLHARCGSAENIKRVLQQQVIKRQRTIKKAHLSVLPSLESELEDEVGEMRDKL